MKGVANNRWFNDWGKVDLWTVVERTVKTIFLPLHSVVVGIRARIFPLRDMSTIGIAISAILLFGLDMYLWKWIKLGGLYPSKNMYVISTYRVLLVFSPFWIWGAVQIVRSRNLAKKMDELFQSAGLKNGLGKTPQFVSDEPIDDELRCLKVKSSFIDKAQFEKERGRLQIGMQYEIDQIREDIPNGIIEIHYSKTPMDELYVAETEDLGSCRFVIGKSRAKVLYGDLRKTPHLLVAGQTGGGKSTFLQQLITSLMIHNKSMQFHLVDLKGGLEFGAFEEIPRFRVASDLTSASSLLTSLEVEMKTRLETLKENTSKNLDEFNLKATENKKAHLHRIMVIVDEAAEMFLARSGQSYKSIQDSRQTISKIARQGRSIGIHLVIATQRPDSNALDSQVKSNLPGVLCFQMVNDSSSISVLGNGRAKLLPPVAGRAIWKEGSKMIEVQTPLLTSQAQATILKTLEPRDNSRKVNSTEAVPVSTILMSRDEIERKEVNQNATEVQEEPGAAS